MNSALSRRLELNHEMCSHMLRPGGHLGASNSKMISKPIFFNLWCKIAIMCFQSVERINVCKILRLPTYCFASFIFENIPFHNCPGLLMKRI